jgi:hypothetical protein
VNVLRKVFGVSFGLLAHDHVEVGAQVLVVGAASNVQARLCMSLSINNRLMMDWRL